jgi:hypothetical protein
MPLSAFLNPGPGMLILSAPLRLCHGNHFLSLFPKMAFYGIGAASESRNASTRTCNALPVVSGAGSREGSGGSTLVTDHDSKRIGDALKHESSIGEVFGVGCNCLDYLLDSAL